MTRIASSLPDVGPGVVVRLRVRGQVYCSRRMPLDEARALARQMRADIQQIATGTGFVPFPDECCEELFVRASAVTAVEVTPVQRVRGSHVSDITVNVASTADSDVVALGRQVQQALRHGAR